MTSPANNFNPEDLLNIWFAATREDPEAIAGRNAWWFGPDPDRDASLARDFGELCEAARAGDLDALAETPGGRLALILLLDQLPRNLYRGTAEAFASDEHALALCLDGHSRGMDEQLSLIERVFFWMPLQHAEDLECQQLAVQLFTSLASHDPAHDALWTNYGEFAEKHHDIIERFGRFPHRNAVLGRKPTDREEAWLDAGGDSFGQ